MFNYPDTLKIIPKPWIHLNGQKISNYDLLWKIDHMYAGKTRKYNTDAYINHLVEVANITHIYTMGYNVCVQAALLHDIVEDGILTLSNVYDMCGNGVANYVEELTDDNVGRNRVERKATYTQQLKDSSEYAQLIKLADIYSNIFDIVEKDLKFAPIYLAEKKNQFAVLTKPCYMLREVVETRLENCEMKLRLIG